MHFQKVARNKTQMPSILALRTSNKLLGYQLFIKSKGISIYEFRHIRICGPFLDFINAKENFAVQITYYHTYIPQ